MRKKIIFSILLVVAAMLAFTMTKSYASGVGTQMGPDARVLTYCVGYTSTATLSSTVTTRNTVLGFTYTDSAAGTGTIWDLAAAASAGSSSSTYVMGEISVAAGSTQTVLFPLPRKLSNGLVVKCSTSTGSLIVYYM